MVFSDDTVWDRFVASSKQKSQTIIDKKGRTITFDYLFSSRSQCTQCHTNAANGVLGLNTTQMNTDFRYPSSGVTDNQLRTYEHIQLCTDPLPDTPNNLPRMPDPSDLSKSLQERVRAYLAANCSMCHRPGGATPTSLDLRWGISNEQMNAIEMPPGNGDLGISGGWDENFSNQNSTTTVKGTLEISNGTVIPDKLILQP
jgi:hypothetical protein